MQENTKEGNETLKHNRVENGVAASLDAEFIDSTEENISLIADAPTSCTGISSPDLLRGQVVAKIRTARDYFMYSTDPAAGGTFETRTSNLNRAIHETFEHFLSSRTAEYRKVRCAYSGVDWNQSGRSSWKTITCQPGSYFLVETLERTMTGDWKGGPNWNPPNFPTSLSWQTGGHGRSDTFARVVARFTDGYIREKVLKELNGIRDDLHALGIPTEVPQA